MPLKPAPTFFSFPADELADGSERAAVIKGLLADPPEVSPKHLYGLLGSRLFDAITELPEYYPTRTERTVLAAQRESIARAVGPAPTLIDLGAGNCEKARSLFGSLEPGQYVAVDMSVEFLQSAMTHLARDFPRLDMIGVGSDFSAGLRLPETVRVDNRLFFYPGSSIGNFTPEDALVFLAEIHQHCPGGGLLIGVDLVKDRFILEAAYDDALGVTAAFNLNLLNNLNVLLGSDFCVGDWQHHAEFNAAQSRIEMHLQARRNITVSWPGGARTFPGGLRIHTENSYKYALSDFKALLLQAGFSRVNSWTDANDWFALCHAAA